MKDLILHIHFTSYKIRICIYIYWNLSVYFYLRFVNVVSYIRVCVGINIFIFACVCEYKRRCTRALGASYMGRYLQPREYEWLAIFYFAWESRQMRSSWVGAQLSFIRETPKLCSLFFSLPLALPFPHIFSIYIRVYMVYICMSPYNTPQYSSSDKLRPTDHCHDGVLYTICHVLKIFFLSPAKKNTEKGAWFFPINPGSSFIHALKYI